MISLPLPAIIAFLPSVGPMEMVIFGAIAVLLFGSRLPEVSRSLGKSLMEFKKGMQGIESEIHSAVNDTNRPAPRRYRDTDDRDLPTAPKFVPPSSEPTDATT